MKLTFITAFIILLLVGCSTPPTKSSAILNTNQLNQVSPLYHLNIIDERDEEFRTKKHWIYKSAFGNTTFAYGDKWFDIGLYDLFSRVLRERIGDNPEGLNAEIILKSFHVLNSASLAFREEIRGVLKVEVAILDRSQKYVFQKNYEMSEKDFIGLVSYHTEQKLMIEVLDKVLNKFLHDLSRDFSRVKQ